MAKGSDRVDKHNAVHRDHVRTGRLPVDMGRILIPLFDLRNVGDYGGAAHVSHAEANITLTESQQLLEAIRSLLPTDIVDMVEEGQKGCWIAYETKTLLYRSGRQKTPLTGSDLKKNGSRMAPSAIGFRIPSDIMASGVQDDTSHEYACFMRRDEDECLDERFLIFRLAQLKEMLPFP